MKKKEEGRRRKEEEDYVSTLEEGVMMGLIFRFNLCLRVDIHISIASLCFSLFLFVSLRFSSSLHRTCTSSRSTSEPAKNVASAAVPISAAVE